MAKKLSKHPQQLIVLTFVDDGLRRCTLVHSSYQTQKPPGWDGFTTITGILY